MLKNSVSGKIDILVVSETKLDASFPDSQFFIEGFCRPYRLDRNKNGGGILVYTRNDITSRVMNDYKLPDKIEGLFIEINLRKKKWLLCCAYNPTKRVYS